MKKIDVIYNEILNDNKLLDFLNVISVVLGFYNSYLNQQQIGNNDIIKTKISLPNLIAASPLKTLKIQLTIFSLIFLQLLLILIFYNIKIKKSIIY